MGNSISFDRSRQPETVIPERLNVPDAYEYRTASGVRIYALPAPEYGVVRVSFVFRAGSSWQRVPFSASATVNNLAEGSRDMTSQQIAERLDYYGSWFDVSMDRDWSVVTFVCLSKFFDKTLEVARRILLEAEFPEEELRTYCAKSRQTLAINRTKVDFNARELFAKSLYGATHPYGVSSPAELYDDLRREDVRAFYEERYTADGCFAVMSGDVDDARLRGVEAFIAGMRNGSAGERLRFPEPCSIARADMPFPGAVQSAIRVGRVLFPRNHPDFIGMQVVAAVLGGYFGSRLVHNLREERGYTYGAYSAMVNFDRSGYFAAATEVGAQFTEDALAQIFAEIERLRRDPVPEEELALVRNIMVGEVLRILDGPFGIADVTIENIQNGFDNGYLGAFVRQVRETTPERVRELALRYLAPDDLTAVVVGPGR
ncbi:MAG TPA: insulinase family protein [Candidatus Tidjanibacter gallistercoris]|nr:insulinase family protein [Candidatus Tidjanibacter gallistercoris]